MLPLTIAVVPATFAADSPAAVITAAPAAPVEVAADHAGTVPVTWTTSSGDQVVAHFPGALLGGHAVYADAQHSTAVAQLADVNTGTVVAPAAQTAQLTSVSGSGVSDGMAALILGGVIWYAVKHKGHHWGWMIAGVTLGTFVGSGSLGVALHNTFGSLIGSAANALGGVL
jgi:hypothetical protein